MERTVSWPIYLYEDKADYDWFVYHRIHQIFTSPTTIGYRTRSGRGYYPPAHKFYLTKYLPYLGTGLFTKWRENN